MVLNNLVFLREKRQEKIEWRSLCLKDKYRYKVCKINREKERKYKKGRKDKLDVTTLFTFFSAKFSPSLLGTSSTFSSVYNRKFYPANELRNRMLAGPKKKFNPYLKWNTSWWSENGSKFTIIFMLLFSALYSSPTSTLSAWLHSVLQRPLIVPVIYPGWFTRLFYILYKIGAVPMLKSLK